MSDTTACFNNPKALKFTAALWAAMLLASTNFAEARSIKKQMVEGKIDSYECGDNCYLTIIDKKQKKLTGLCIARECKAWNYETRMPSFFVGKWVVVTLGEGVQLNGSGVAMSKMDAFTTIEFTP